MDHQQIKCHQCWQKQINSIKQCPQRASQACPYAVTSIKVSPYFIGHAWPDYMDTGIQIILISSVFWLLYIVITGGKIFSVGLLGLSGMWIRLLVWSSMILFMYRGFSRISAKKIQLPTPLQRLQKRLVHYYDPAAHEGFVAYERFGISIFYGATAVFPITLTPSKTKLGKYPPSFLAATELVELDDFSQRVMAQHHLIPQIVRWTLLGLVAQDLIQLSHVKLTRRNIKNNKISNTLVFATPKSKLVSHQAIGLLEKEFIGQLRQRIDKTQPPAHWDGISVYELIYNLYEKAIYAPEEQLLKRIINDGTAHGWAKRPPTKSFKAKMKSMYVIPWQLALDHKSNVVSEQRSWAEWDHNIQSEHKRFVVDLETAVLKAMETCRRRNVS